MGYNIGDNVYALHITNNQERICIINGEIDNFQDCVNNYLKFYYYESILLKFKDLVDKNNKISKRIIMGYLDIFAANSLYKTLTPHIPNLCREFVEINDCTYPISLVSTNRNLLTKYFKFLKDIFDIEKGRDIYDFIKKNFR